MANAYLSVQSILGFAKEATRGTVNTGATVSYVPVTSPQVTPNQIFLRDEAFRGSPVMLYDEVQGVRHDDYEHKTYLFADTWPVYMKALLGGTDTVTTSTNSYSHAIPLLNSASTGSQPPSYSIQDFDGANYFLLLNGQAVSLTMTAGAEAAAEATLKWLAWPYTSATSASAPFTSPSWTSEHLIPSWNTTVTIASTGYTNVASFEVTIDRKTEPIHTFGTQKSLYNFSGPIDVSGKMTLVVNANNDPFSTGSGTALGRSPEACVVTLTDPNDVNSTINDSISLQMSAVQFQASKRTRGKNYTELELEFHAESNSTDATTGYAPITSTTVNGISAAF